MKNTIFVDPKNEKNRGLKLLFNQRNHWCDYFEEATKTTHVEPNNNYESSASLNQSSFPFRIFDTSSPQDQTGPVYF